MTHPEWLKLQALRWLNKSMATLWQARNTSIHARLELRAAIRNYRRVFV